MTGPVECDVDAGALSVAYLTYGPEDGWPCILAHGFPYDVQAYAETAPKLVVQGARVIVPYLRGYGPTRFLDPGTPRSGEQAALGADLLALMDALEIDRAVLGGYDWGGRACCVVAALWPDRVIGLVSGNSYNIFDHARSWDPAPAEIEATLWYQYYFHAERGRRGLIQNRRDLARTIWAMWSPDWAFTQADFDATAPAFDNPDFVEVVIHSYRHRYGLVPGDPAYAHIDTMLTAQPPITIPAVTVDGATDGLDRDTSGHAPKFKGPHDHQIWPATGHNLPQEQPDLWAQAVLQARAMAGLAA